MSRKKEPYSKVIDLLQELHKKYPSYTIGRHLSTALADYGDLWGTSDKEVVFALEKYLAELEYTIDDDIERIIEEGKNLDKLFPKHDLFTEDEEDEY